MSSRVVKRARRYHDPAGSVLGGVLLVLTAMHVYLGEWFLATLSAFCTVGVAYILVNNERRWEDTSDRGDRA